jgi:hypothetical protein
MSILYSPEALQPGDVPAELIQVFRARTQAAKGGHLLWEGYAEKGTTPLLIRNDHSYPVLRLSWCLQWNTEPDGHIRNCGTRLCVAGTHLTDRRLRQREQLLAAAVLGIDMSGTCAAGHPRAEHGIVLGIGQKVACRACQAAARIVRAAERRVA